MTSRLTSYISSPFWIGATLKGKNLLPRGTNSFFLEQTPFQMEKESNNYFDSLISALKVYPSTLTIVLLIPNMPSCFCKQCRPRSVGFWSILKKPADLDLHCLPLSMWLCINNLNQVIWLAENWEWEWPLNLFSMTRVKSVPVELVAIKNYNFHRQTPTKMITAKFHSNCFSSFGDVIWCFTHYIIMILSIGTDKSKLYEASD